MGLTEQQVPNRKSFFGKFALHSASLHDAGLLPDHFAGKGTGLFVPVHGVKLFIFPRGPGRCRCVQPEVLM